MFIRKEIARKQRRKNAAGRKLQEKGSKKTQKEEPARKKQWKKDSRKGQKKEPTEINILQGDD